MESTYYIVRTGLGKLPENDVKFIYIVVGVIHDVRLVPKEKQRTKKGVSRVSRTLGSGCRVR